MFRYLGRFVVLAVCLFALAIVMVGCGEGEVNPPLPPPPPVETPMEKLTGTWLLVEATAIFGGNVTTPPVSAELHLRPEGNGWIATYVSASGDSSGASGPTWTANATTITYIDSDGERRVEDYTLEGKFLTLASFDENFSRIEKWRKD